MGSRNERFRGERYLEESEIPSVKWDAYYEYSLRAHEIPYSHRAIHSCPTMIEAWLTSENLCDDQSRAGIAACCGANAICGDPTRSALEKAADQEVHHLDHQGSGASTSLSNEYQWNDAIYLTSIKNHLYSSLHLKRFEGRQKFWCSFSIHQWWCMNREPITNDVMWSLPLEEKRNNNHFYFSVGRWSSSSAFSMAALAWGRGRGFLPLEKEKAVQWWSIQISLQWENGPQNLSLTDVWTSSISVQV